jgi:hypothetical protein
VHGGLARVLDDFETYVQLASTVDTAFRVISAVRTSLGAETETNRRRKLILVGLTNIVIRTNFRQERPQRAFIQYSFFFFSVPPLFFPDCTRCRLHDVVGFDQTPSQICYNGLFRCTVRLMPTSRSLVRSHVHAQKHFLTASTSRAQSGSVVSTGAAASQVCFPRLAFLLTS